MNERLRALTNPRNVVLIGASNDPQRLTARPMNLLRQHGYRGDVFPVNPNRDTVQGIKAYGAIDQVPHPIDFAYILLNGTPAMTAMEECARAGVKVVCVLADGFAEKGPEGLARQQQLAKIADDAGVFLLGPNSMGVVDTRSGFSCTTNAAFAAKIMGVGRTAVISQSGNIIGTLFSRGQARGIAFSTLVSVGNEAQSGIGEIGDILLGDPETDNFILFMETIRNADKLAQFARRAAEMGKPVVAYMLGKSEEGKALSVSHTGALTGSSQAINSFLAHNGIHRVDLMDALLEAPLALSSKKSAQKRPKTATVIATTGGGGAMVVDQLSVRGVEIAGCSTPSRVKLEATGISLGTGKLIDVTLAGANYETMKAVVSELIADPDTGVLIVAIGSSAQFNPEIGVRPIIDAVAEADQNAAPVFGFPLPHAEESMRLLDAGGVPSFRSVESCAEIISVILNAKPPTLLEDVTLPEAVKVLLSSAPDGIMNEVNSAEVFAGLGIAVPRQIVLETDATLPEKLPFSFPVVAKLISSDLPHKTEAGALQVGLETREDLVRAIQMMKSSVSDTVPDANLDGVLMQEMCSGLCEALIGLTRDPSVGPIVTVAMGGIMTEIYNDASVRPAPVCKQIAREMIAEVKGFELLRGFRNMPPGDLEALANAICSVSTLALSERVHEAEINPVLIRAKGEGVVLLDALICLKANSS